MIREQIEQAAKEAVQNYFPCNGKYPCEERNYCKFCNGYNSAFDCDEDCSADDFNEGFIDGAQWRINSVWHDREEQPEVERWFIFKADDTNPFKKPTIKKIAYYTNRIENDKGLDWLKMVAEYKILCWAYVDDLLPERKEDAE